MAKAGRMNERSSQIVPERMLSKIENIYEWKRVGEVAVQLVNDCR